MRKISFMKASKKGITLVESVLAVVILAILCIGILSLLTAGGTKIYQISQESNAHAQAVQKLDYLISAISNGSPAYISTHDGGTSSLNIASIQTDLEVAINTSESNMSTYSDGLKSIDATFSSTDIRGWYITLTYNGATVSGFASHTEGDFD